MHTFFFLSCSPVYWSPKLKRLGHRLTLYYSFTLSRQYSITSCQVFYQYSFSPNQQRAQPHDHHYLTSHNRAVNPTNILGVVENGLIYNFVSSRQPACVLTPCHVRILLTSTSWLSAVAWPQDMIWVRCHENWAAGPDQTGLSLWWKPGHQPLLGKQVCHSRDQRLDVAIFRRRGHHQNKYSCVCVLFDYTCT